MRALPEAVELRGRVFTLDVEHANHHKKQALVEQRGVDWVMAIQGNCEKIAWQDTHLGPGRSG